MNLFRIFISCLALNSTLLSQDINEDINKLFKSFNDSTPGYAIAISKHGETLFKSAYGSANLDYKIPLTTQSAFSIASVSKQFTAATIALLILDGKLSLETDASQYIPELKKYRHTIRIKHLIYNTSGIKDYHRIERKNGKSWITLNYFDIDECIAHSMAEEELQFKPGDRWDYCNVNFMLLTKIVEKVSGEKFRDFAKKRLFIPLGMKNSLINDDATQIIKNRVTAYNYRTEDYVESYRENGIHISSEGLYIQHPRVSPHYGGSGVVTTIDDLLLWSKNMYIKDVFGEDFYKLMHQTPSFNHDRNNQAFGLYLGDFNGRKIVAWDGGDWGISSQMLRFPDQGIAIIVLSNLGSGESYRKANAIADILIDAGIIE